MTLENQTRATSDWPSIVKGLLQDSRLEGITTEDRNRLINYSDQIADIPTSRSNFQVLARAINNILKKYLGPEYLYNYDHPKNGSAHR